MQSSIQPAIGSSSASRRSSSTTPRPTSVSSPSGSRWTGALRAETAKSASRSSCPGTTTACSICSGASSAGARGRLPLVISNHPDCAEASLPRRAVPSRPVRATSRRQKRSCSSCSSEIDLVVLARYMQLLSADFLDRLAAPVINIHHSFLPAFAGASPYTGHFERGVKMIGATATTSPPSSTTGRSSSRTSRGSATATRVDGSRPHRPRHRAPRARASGQVASGRSRDHRRRAYGRLPLR